VSTIKNHLAEETSPYLLQHADNPVNWYPWGDKALSKAKESDKPILLSIGYSACHWCHVMEHESFEDPETAKIMNDNFICIKVDREERPDIDQIYMTYVQMTTGSGGWPLNVFLTPDLEPFYGGTYFPPEESYGRPSWKRILTQVSKFYQEDKTALNQNIDAVRDAFEQNLIEEQGTNLPDKNSLDLAAQNLVRMFDRQYGGLGRAPKFPAIQPFNFLLNYYNRTGNEEYLHAVTYSLRKMAEGGIYDQIGGGFARYSVDAKWLVPHFEKMLYDNAQLAPLYLDTYLITKDKYFLNIMTEILDFVMREMLSPEGGFYSSLDADSEGVEGKFYVWKKSEVDSILGVNSQIFCDFYDVSENGNFEGKNILNMHTSLSATATRFNKSEQDVTDILQNARKQLLEARGTRIRPGLDDKILTAWNALMLSAFARAYQNSPNAKYEQVIRNNIKFLRDKLSDQDKLLRTYNHGKAQLDGYLEDYAFLIRALFDSYEALFEDEYLVWAYKLMSVVDDNFWDSDNGGYFFTDIKRNDLLYRMKDEHDQSIPSGTGIMLHNNLRFYSLTEQSKLVTQSEIVLKKYGQDMIRNPYGYASFLIGLEFYYQKPQEIVVILENSVDKTKYQNIIFDSYNPVKVVILTEKNKFPDILSASLFQNKETVNGQTTAYVCHNFTCSLPQTDPEKFKNLLLNRK